MENIVSITANSKGRAYIYQRKNGKVTHTRPPLFDNWIIVQDTANLKPNCEIAELDGDLSFRYKITGKIRTQNINRIAEEFDYHEIIAYNNVQQYLIASGNTYFSNMEFQDLYRLQFDIETTTKRPGYISNPEYDEIYMIAVSDTNEYEKIITGTESEIIQRLIKIIREKDPDVIENHNIFGFDLPFICKRAKTHGIPLNLGRDGSVWSYEDSVKIGGKSEKFTRYCINGREIIDTMFLTRRHIHELRSRGYGLKNTAKYLDVASEGRTYIAGNEIWNTWKDNPDQVEKYALDDVKEARAISDELLPIDFELTKIFPDKLEKVATAGTATLIDMLLVSEYLNAGHSIPKATSKKQKYAGGLTEIYRKGVLHDIVKADVSSMYPSIMLTHRIKPDHDPIGIFKDKLQELTNKRLEAKTKLKTGERNEGNSKAIDAYQKALKLIINSFYGLLGTGYSSFHFNSPSGAKKVTAIGRDILREMLKAGEANDGIPVEADTDGIYFAGIGKDKAVEFVDSINKQLDRSGITIDFDGYWKSMYSYGKKNYTLIDSEGNLTLKGIFNQGDEENFISKAKVNILKYFFDGNIERIKQSYANNLEKITQGKLTIDDITKKQRLGKDLEEYSDQTTAIHVKALRAAGITSANQGYLVEYYKSSKDWKLTSGFDETYDIKHYQNRFHSAIDRAFQYALNESDRQVLFSDQQFTINLNAISPQATETNVEPAVIDTSQAEAWIELSFGNTLKEIDAPDRWNWTRIDDIHSVRDFVEAHDHLDVHRSNVAYWADTAPVQDLSRYKQVGAFFLEVEGKNYDKDLQGNDIIDDRNDIVVECARNVMDILIDLGVEKDDIVAYYNGGKSIYIFVPMGYICAEPRFKLNEIYKKIAEDLIIPELPEDLQRLIDKQIYDFKHTLRLLSTKHHQGKFGYRVEANDLYQENWENLTNREGKAKITPTFSPPPIIPEDDSKVIKEFAKIAKSVTNTPQSSSSKKRKSKAKEYRDNTRQIEYILSNINPDYITPCIRNIAIAIRDKESIGFGGRNKFIAEMLILGRAQGLTDREIENEICKLFLKNDNPNRYAVMEADNRDNPNPSGYRLKNNYFDIDKLETFDPTCKTCQEFCEPAKCYRHQQFKTEKKPTPYSDFIRAGRQKTAEAITTEPQKEQITAVDASLSSGKTYQISKKAAEQSNNNELSAIFTHSHNASQEICNNVKQFGLENGVCIHMRGKSEATCHQEHRNCQSCQYRGDFFSSDKETREQARQALVTQCQRSVIDLQKAQALAEKYEVCPFVIMRALAITTRAGIVTTNHNYLGDVNLHPILNRIKSDYYFVDEADQLITNMMRYQQKMTIAKTRSKLRHTYQKSCGNQCDKCNIHFADCWSRGLDTREHIKSQEQEDTQNPENFIDTLRHAVETVNLLDPGIIHDIFDHDALTTNIDKLEQILSLMDDDCTPYEAITGLEKTLINSDLDFIEVDKIYEGRTTYDGKVIFPDENIVSIKMENPIDTDTLAMMLDPDPDASVDELQFGNRQLNYHSLFVDSGEKAQIRGTETEESIKICLAFTNLIEKGGCQVGLYFETRRVGEDKTIPNRKQNIISCGLSLRVFDIDGFQAVTNKMERNNTLLLSGTFLSREMLAKSLLLPETDIDYKNKTLPMHDKFLIIHTDAKGSKSTNGVKVSNLSNSHLTKIYRRVAELLDEVHILNFEKNTNQGSIFFFNLNSDEEHNKDFYIENLCSRTPQIADWCIYESSDDRKRTITVDKLVIDKLRSSRARAVNRGVFDICTVNGNGYVNWYDFLPYVQKMRDMVDPDIQLDDIFEYDRKKVVAQAITRAPRDENRTVGLYFGDMQYIDYPEYLKPCVVLLDEVLSKLKEARPDDFICNIDNQIEITAQVIVAFIKGEVTHDDFSAVFDKIEFVGEYKGGAHESRKQQVDYSGLPDVDIYAVKSFVENYKEGADDVKTVNAVIDKLNHVKECIEDKGYLHKWNDKKGVYSDWTDLIDLLVKIGFLKEKKLQSEGKGRPKTVFIISET